jgi:small subunit ribosomal protein S3e
MRAELNHLFRQELSQDGYSGCEIRIVPPSTEITVSVTRAASLFENSNRRIHELTSLIQKRWGKPVNGVKILAERVKSRGLSAVAQAESMIFKIKAGLAVRRAAYGILRFVKGNEGRGVEVRVAGKLRGQRAKAMKFSDGYMIKSGDPMRQLVDRAVRHLILEQGALGIRVKIMLPTKLESSENGKDYRQPDVVHVHEPKEEELRRQEPNYQKLEENIPHAQQ